MYEIYVDGVTRHAAYAANAEKVVRVGSIDIDDDNKSCDLLQVTIRDDSSSSNLTDHWLVLHGKPREIVEIAEGEFPIVFLHADMIFDALDKIGDEEPVTLTYSTENLPDLIRKSAIYQALLAARSDILRDLFGIDTARLHVLGEPDHQQ